MDAILQNTFFFINHQSLPHSLHPSFFALLPSLFSSFSTLPRQLNSAARPLQMSSEWRSRRRLRCAGFSTSGFWF
uniref:Uncharacterized protein n=1 Tax=Globodera rostochiensis TaxID=31243 RepID=A0A914HY52_GLORO